MGIHVYSKDGTEDGRDIPNPVKTFAQAFEKYRRFIKINFSLEFMYSHVYFTFIYVAVFGKPTG